MEREVNQGRIRNNTRWWFTILVSASQVIKSLRSSGSAKQGDFRQAIQRSHNTEQSVSGRKETGSTLLNSRRDFPRPTPYSKCTYLTSHRELLGSAIYMPGSFLSSISHWSRFSPWGINSPILTVATTSPFPSVSSHKVRFHSLKCAIVLNTSLGVAKSVAT